MRSEFLIDEKGPCDLNDGYKEIVFEKVRGLSLELDNPDFNKVGVRFEYFVDTLIEPVSGEEFFKEVKVFSAGSLIDPSGTEIRS